MITAACIRRPLAGSEQCIVEECGCGAMHVTIGAITLRLCPSTVADVTTTLNEAMQKWALAQLGGRAGTGRAARGEGASS